MSNRILYIGNHLGTNGKYPSVAQSMSINLNFGYEFILVSSKKNKVLRLLDMISSLFKYGKNSQPIIIDVYSTSAFYYALLVGMICRFNNLNYICVLHGGNLPLRLMSSPISCKLLFKYSSKLVAPSAFLQQRFAEYDYHVVNVIPNPIDLNLYPFKFRSNPSPRILWVRAFDEIYNPYMALNFIEELSHLFTDAHLGMVGPDRDGSLTKCKNLAIKMKLEEKITFYDEMSKKEWIEISRDYDIFINTSRFDNTPVSLIEAMALGLPIVTTNVGGIPFLLKNEINALLVNSDDHMAMVSAVKRLLYEPKISQNLSISARELAESFDMIKIIHEWKNILCS